MDTKSVVMLGFINKASQYLKNEFIKNGQEDDLASLDKLHIDDLKEYVVSKAEGAFSNAKVSIEDLLKVGADAFDDFNSKNKKVDSKEVLNDFNDLFDSDSQNTETVKNDLDELLSFYEPITTEHFVDDDDEYLRQITEAAGQQKQEEIDIKPARHAENKNEDLDDIFSEIVGNEKPQTKQEPQPRQELRNTSNDEYLRGLIDDLKYQLEEDKIKPNKVERVSVFEKISDLYPYLSGGFIRAVYSLKESIAKENPAGSKIVILHRVNFKDLESLRQFVEIVSNHDYTVNVDENKRIVDVFKEHINVDGKILTNIFEIANQAKVLDGDYEGYRIVNRED